MKYERLTYLTHLCVEKLDQNWVVVTCDKINLLVDETHFHNPTDKYIVVVANVSLNVN